MGFPSTPVDEQLYTNALGTLYKYDAAKTCWNIAGFSGGGAGLVSATYVPVVSTDGTAYINSHMTDAADVVEISRPRNMSFRSKSTILLDCSGNGPSGSNIGLISYGPILIDSTGPSTYIDLSVTGGDNTVTLSAMDYNSEINIEADKHVEISSPNFVGIDTLLTQSSIALSAVGGSNTVTLSAMSSNSSVVLNGSETIKLSSPNGTVDSSSTFAKIVALSTAIGPFGFASGGPNQMQIGLHGTSDGTSAYMNLSALGVSNSINISAGSSGISGGAIYLDTGLGGGDQIELRSTDILIQGPLTVTGQFGCNGQSSQGKYVVGAAAATAGDVITLANNLRSMALAYGFASTT